jgi:hypothetical protein
MGSGCGANNAAPAAPPAPAHAVSAVVLMNGCVQLGKDNARLAELAMNQLVDGCGSFSGGSVRFTATLLPGGAIEFERRPNQSQAIPICVLQHPLVHQVRLQSACVLDVQLEGSSMYVPKPGDAGP